jgi:hypothetical protein
LTLRRIPNGKPKRETTRQESELETPSTIVDASKLPRKAMKNTLLHRKKRHAKKGVEKKKRLAARV